MKNQIIILGFRLMLLIILVSSCGRSTESLVTPSPLISSSPTISVVSSPSFTLPPTDFSTSTSTPVAIPTLPYEEARIELLKMLATNGGCQLPCLWGIMLMKSSEQEVRSILAPFSGLSYSVYLNSTGHGSISPRYIEGDLEIYTSIGYLTNLNDNKVNHLVFSAEAHRPLTEGGYEDVFDSKFFGEKVSAYALRHVLSEQGVPSAIMIATFGGALTRGGTGGFDILLLYPDQGILVNYTTQMHLIGEMVRGCPSNAHVEMELHPSGRPDSFFELLKQTDWAIKLNYYKPLDEATSLSVEEFYETFREPTDVCIETLASLWPLPEP